MQRASRRRPLATAAGAESRRQQNFWRGGASGGDRWRRLNGAARARLPVCATGALHPESLRRRPGELTRALDTGTTSSGKDALHEELEWRGRDPGCWRACWASSAPGGGPRRCREMLLRLGCYDGLHLDTATRARLGNSSFTSLRFDRLRRPQAVPACRPCAAIRTGSCGKIRPAHPRRESRPRPALLVRRIDRRVAV